MLGRTNDILKRKSSNFLFTTQETIFRHFLWSNPKNRMKNLYLGSMIYLIHNLTLSFQIVRTKFRNWILFDMIRIFLIQPFAIESKSLCMGQKILQNHVFVLFQLLTRDNSLTQNFIKFSCGEVRSSSHFNHEYYFQLQNLN